ncbi:MAG TPA: Do family serine endopeptidase [Pyrinomonadaceae bacterium]
MTEASKGQTNRAEQAMLRRLRVWIAALAALCLLVGLGLGAMLASKQAVAQNEAPIAQIARAPEALSASFAEIARRVEPAVVNIDTVSAPQIAAKDDDEEEDEAEKEAPGGNSNPLLDMLRRRMRRPSRGVGSGFVIDPKGLILTNYHVVQGASKINVKLQSGATLRGEVAGFDEETDLAIVRVRPPQDLPAVQFGNSDDVQVGDWVLAIGSPFGLEQTVTAGIISTRERQTDPSAAFQRFLQTDAAINRGNSGGPLVNMRGEVIGVNSQIATSTGDYNGIGFALPANEAAFVYKQIVGGGKVRRGYLGIYLQPVRAEFAQVYGLAEAKGAIVRDVADQNGPAAKAGILTNDIIVEFDGRPVTDAQDLINKVAATEVGRAVQVAYLRELNNKLERRTAAVTVGERPPSRTLQGDRKEEPDAKKKKSSAAPTDRPTLGLKVSELTDQLAEEKNLRGLRGVIITDVEDGSLADDSGLDEGVVILRVNRVAVNSLADFQGFVNSLKPGDAVVLHVANYQNDRILRRIVQFTFQ